VPPMLERAQQLARVQADAQIAAAQARMRAQLDDEIVRLDALRRVNPSVRADEPDGLRAQRDALASALGGARLRLDAARFVVSLDFLTLK
jgi:ATP-dependent helicase HepA